MRDVKIPMTGHFHIYSREYSREYYSREACAVLYGYDTTSYGSSMHSWIGSVYDKTVTGILNPTVLPAGTSRWT